MLIINLTCRGCKVDYNIEESLGFIISRTHIKMKNNLTKALKPYDVTTEQWALLNRLWVQDGISQKELSDKSLKDQPTTTRILDKLEQHGLIERQSNPEDRRAFLIYLTREGRAIKDSLVSAACQALGHSLKGFTEQDKSTLKHLLTRITDNLD